MRRRPSRLRILAGCSCKIHDHIHTSSACKCHDISYPPPSRDTTSLGTEISLPHLAIRRLFRRCHTQILCQQHENKVASMTSNAFENKHTKMFEKYYVFTAVVGMMPDSSRPCEGTARVNIIAAN